MRRRAKTDANQSAIVDALRGYGCLVLSLASIGNGCPDLLVATPDRKRIGLIEVKDGSRVPSERKLTDDQIDFWNEWQGAPMAIVESVDDALRFARALTFEQDILRRIDE